MSVDAQGNTFEVEMIPDNHAAVTADYDRDGLVDIFAGYVLDVNSSLFRNSSDLDPTDSQWIQIMLIGNDSNRSAIGARVECEADLNGSGGDHDENIGRAKKTNRHHGRDRERNAGALRA